MLFPSLRTAAFALVLSFSAAAASLDPVKLLEVPKRMQQFVDTEVISGAVTLVARDGQVSLEAVGYSDLAAKRPMRTDDLFWIASMTKPITSTAILMLQDEGKLSVDDPVEKHLPEFKSQWVIAEKSNDQMRLQRAARPITIRDLLTHTSGLNDVTGRAPTAALAELVTGYSQAPLLFAPGSKWQYCNPGINTLGRIVEVVSGKSYHDFLQTRLFRPLGMKDTTLYPSASQVKRLAKSYGPGLGGKGLAETNLYFMGTAAVTSANRTAVPAGGLFSTAGDLAKFYQMILDVGTYRGKRYVSEAAVRQMTSVQSGDLKTGFTEGNGWGLGWCIVRQPQGVTAALSTGSFGHGGAFGTQGWIDPQRKMIYVLLIQRAKLPNADASDVRRDFQNAAVAAFTP
jgi:CubicO group peptidase (beta-lactamase class C family)